MMFSYTAQELLTSTLNKDKTIHHFHHFIMQVALFNVTLNNP